MNPNVPRETFLHLDLFFKTFFKDLDFNDKLGKLDILKTEYFEWNSKINISAIRDEKGFWEKHVIDSLCLASYIHNNKQSYKYIYDIGSGGGFPGLVLSIMLPQKVYMVESKNKKCKVINEIINKLALNAETIWKRFEDFKHIENKAIVTSRALGNTQLIHNHFSAISRDFVGIYMITEALIPNIPNSMSKVKSVEYDFVSQKITKALLQHRLFEF